MRVKKYRGMGSLEAMTKGSEVRELPRLLLLHVFPAIFLLHASTCRSPSLR